MNWLRWLFLRKPALTLEQSLALAAANAGFAGKEAYDAIQTGQGSTINGKDNQIATGTDSASTRAKLSASAATCK